MVPPADDLRDPRGVLEAFFAEMIALREPRLHIDTKPEGDPPLENLCPGPHLVGAKVFRWGFRLWFFGRLHPIEVTGVEAAVRGRDGRGRHVLELHGDMAVRVPHERPPLLGFARVPRIEQRRTPVLRLVSLEDGS